MTPPVGEGLVVVSNREPYRHHYEENESGERSVSVERPAGGLAAGLDPVMQELGGTWVAWGDGDADYDVADAEGRVEVPPDDPAYTLKRLELSDAEVRDYYRGYANRALWPLCHDMLDKVAFEERQWATYNRVNERFADAVVAAVEGPTTVWFQDYHFALAPRMVRERLTEDALLAHFWHIPWPSTEAFRACPQGERILDGLLANDLLGFHVPEYAENFLDCVAELLPSATVDYDSYEIDYEGHTTHVEALPMGIDADRFRELGRDADEADWRSFRRTHGIADGTRVAIGVDRLDYTKGIPRRIEALEHLFETRPELRGEFTYVQKAIESRSAIPEYQAHQQEVYDAVERINERFATDDWQPVVYIEEHLSRDLLCTLYRYSDLALVSSLRDGMNLVSKEYVATQVENDGALVLSELAGAASELGDHAFTANPYDTPAHAAAIEAALTVDPAERRYRMQRLREQVHARDMERWIEDVLAAAERAHEPLAEPPTVDD